MIDEILNDYLIWHWKQFKTGKFEKLGHIPYSWSTQDQARQQLYEAVIAELIDEVEMSGNTHLNANAVRNQYRRILRQRYAKLFNIKEG